MKKFFLSSAVALMAMAAQAATASYSNGKLTLDFIGDWAVVDNGTGDISIVNAEGLQLATAIGTPDYDFTNTGDYQVLVYSIAGRLDAGDYTVKVADGAIIGHKTDPWSFDLSSIGALDLPVTVTGEGGEESPETAAFNAPTLELLEGAGVNVKYTYPNSVEPDGYNKAAVEGKQATLTEDGVQVATAPFGFQMEPTYFYGAHFDYTIVEGRQYKATFPEGCWYIEKIDDYGNSTVELTSTETSFSWVGGETSGNVGGDDQPSVDPEQPGEDPVDPQSPVTVDFKLGNSLAAITNNMVVANITVDREYYDIYWTVTCATDPDFFFGGSSHAASAGAGTYTIIASTPSAEPVVLNSGRTYTFTFQTCEFGWDAYKTVATFDVAGSGAAAEQFSDIVITDFDGTMGALGYNFKNNYTVTFSAPVINVKAFSPQGMDGTYNFPVAAADNEGLKWTIDVSSMAGDEGAFELHIQAVDAATGLRLLGTYHLDNSFIYTISISTSNPDDEPGLIDPVLPDEELEIASVTIDGEVIKLSETEAVELAAYPEGATFTIALADEAIKKVTYEIIDHTSGEILKSIADLNKGDEGKWTAVMPRTYEFAAGHVYYIHVVARDGMSSFTSNVLHEYNFLVNGTSDVAVYSTVKVASINPDTDEIIRVDAPVISISFTEPIASVSATAVLGQMSSMALAPSCITTTDNQTWEIAVPAGVISGGALSLNIVAIDNAGNRVTDAENGVGLPENCYLQYGWLSTIGLPVPELVEDGQTFTVIDALHFAYEGIGLNQDNLTATWKQISITRNGEPVAIELTENMFAAAGDASVGATELVLTLAEPLTEAGTYVITVPALAFMLGHDNANFYSGDCQFTVYVSGTTGIQTIEAAQQNGVVMLNGIRADHAVKGAMLIVNGQKVIVK